MAEAVNSPADLEREPDVGPVPDEQPNAPYLEAVVAYAFRGPARFHVPGHKGGPGADPGVRKAIGVDALAADVPQDIHGIDLGPSPTPYERAEALTRAVRAARERGAIVVVVAHRPIGIEGVDQILVLKDGRMQAFGPKETVLGQVLQPRVAAPSPIKIVSDGGVAKS